MVKTYELSEFIFLLRLGLWGGGEITGLGYVSKTRGATGEIGNAGLTGMCLGSGVMLENSRSDLPGESNLVFSIYEPYTGDYRFQVVTANCDGDIKRMLLAILDGTEWINDRGGRKIREYVSLQSKRRYGVEHKSLRSGLLPTVKRMNQR